MSDVPVYLVANLIVTDVGEYRKYEKGFFRILKKHGGSFLSYDDHADHFEGYSARSGRMILCGFPSETAAKNWYADADYQALSEHRRAGTRLEFLTMMRGVPPRS